MKGENKTESKNGKSVYLIVLNLIKKKKEDRKR